MNRNATLSLGVFSTLLAGLLFAGLRADDTPKNDKAAAKEEAPMPKDVGKPKPLSDSVKKGLEYLVKSQLDNGGWNQGGGWRVNNQGGGRVEGNQVQDPADLGNTCIAVLAFIRAGNTPKEGPYAKNVARAIDFIMTKVEKSDEKSLLITDVKGTQMQSKIGPYIDTFLAALVLAELKGKMPEESVEKRLVASLDKTIGKIEKNQKADGTFEGNGGWASVLSHGLCVKSLNRAAQNGAKVSDEALERTRKASADNFDGKAGRFKTAGEKGAAAPTDAGVPLYGQSADLANLQESVNTLQKKKKDAEAVLKDKDAPKERQEKAREELKKIDETEKVNKQAVAAVAGQARNADFVRGFGSNGGEEFLSFMNISETLRVKGGEDWEKWDKTISDAAAKAQDKDGSWSGHHCITGKTFCTGAALLVLMADRAPMPAVAKADVKKEEKPEEKK
jgi:hypothetical protein